MNRPIIKSIADFGPLLIFFIIYFGGDNSLEKAIPPFVIATLISLVTIYFLEKKFSFKNFFIIININLT